MRADSTRAQPALTLGFSRLPQVPPPESQEKDAGLESLQAWRSPVGPAHSGRSSGVILCSPLKGTRWGGGLYPRSTWQLPRNSAEHAMRCGNLMRNRTVSTLRGVRGARALSTSCSTTCPEASLATRTGGYAWTAAKAVEGHVRCSLVQARIASESRCPLFTLGMGIGLV